MHDDIKKALEVLQKGGVILYPTDTIWGLGCDATNEAAVKRIYEIKSRITSYNVCYTKLLRICPLTIIRPDLPSSSGKAMAATTIV